MKRAAIVAYLLLQTAFCLLPRHQAVLRTTSVVDNYGSMPKGVTLEGVADGLGEIRSVVFDKATNAFVINGGLRYESPLPANAMARLIAGLCQDDLIGVSFAADKSVIVYGDFQDSDPLVKDLVTADMFLGGVTFGINNLYKEVKLPGDYQPRRPVNRRIEAGSYYNFHKFVFASEGNVLRRERCSMEVILFPISDIRSRDGGFMPDFEKMKAGTVEPEDRANADHIEKNQQEYMKLPVVARAVTIGEAAAFVRALRDAETVDIDALLKSMR